MREPVLGEKLLQHVPDKTEEREGIAEKSNTTRGLEQEAPILWDTAAEMDLYAELKGKNEPERNGTPHP
jgi:hypothetical protein